MSKAARRVRDRWRSKAWYSIVSPPYFGGKEIGGTPSGDSKTLIGRVIETTLYEITEDFSHQYLKLLFQVTGIDGTAASTIFKGHEYARDYLRSLVRRGSTRIDGIFSVTTKDGYKLQVSIVALSLARVKFSQETAVRSIMRKIINEKAKALNFDQLAQELVLGKLASDIYNEAKKIVPIRHLGVRKSRLVKLPLMEEEATAA